MLLIFGQPRVEGGLQLPTLPIPTLQGRGMLRSHHHGGECLGQAPHSCCGGVKGKIILQPTAVLGEEHGLGQRGEIIARPACQACACVWLNLRAVTIKLSLNNERCSVLPTLLLHCSVLLLQLHFAWAPVYFMPNLCCCRASSAWNDSFLFCCSQLWQATGW